MLLNDAFYPPGSGINFALVLHLSEAQLRLLRTELGSLLVPEPGRLRIGRDAAFVRRADHGRIVGLRQDERGFCLMGIGGTCEQQSRTREVAHVEQALRPVSYTHLTLPTIY